MSSALIQQSCGADVQGGIVLIQGHTDAMVHLLCLLPNGELLGHTRHGGAVLGGGVAGSYRSLYPR